MKVRWTLYDMDWLKKRHLASNLQYWKDDILFNAREMINNVEKSRSLKLLSVSKNAEMVINMAKARNEMTASDIDQIVSYEIQSPIDGDNNVVVLTLFVNNNYFVTADSAKNQLGRRASRILKVFGRQELISSFEGEISKLYTKEFYGEILEDDGNDLHIRKKS
jgi:hypothetical protein